MRCILAVSLLFAGTVVVKGLPNPIEVSVNQLIAKPQQFQGDQVAVTGYFECGFEAGCELRSTRRRQDKLRTILLDFSQKQAVALEKRQPSHGWLRVVGRFEYSGPTPERVISEADPRDPRSRGIVSIWQGFGFHACQITGITTFERVYAR